MGSPAMMLAAWREANPALEETVSSFAAAAAPLTSSAMQVIPSVIDH